MQRGSSEGAVWSRILLALFGVGFVVALPLLLRSGPAEGARPLEARDHLRRIAREQARFHESDGNMNGTPDFGTLAELAQGSADLEREGGQQPRSGYVFFAGPGVDAQATWYGIANPTSRAAAEAPAPPALFVNQDGVLYRRSAPISVAEVRSGCPPPLGCERLGE